MEPTKTRLHLLSNPELASQTIELPFTTRVWEYLRSKFTGFRNTGVIKGLTRPV